MNTALLQALKVRAHHLKPVILLGNKGLTDALVEETSSALTTHELIKIKLSGLEREEKSPVVAELCLKLDAECIQLIGNMATIYRKNPEKKTAKKRLKKKIRKTTRPAISPRPGNYGEKKPMRAKRSPSLRTNKSDKD